MNQIWTEKYRPNTIDGYVFMDPEHKLQVEQWIKDKSIPHLLFSGPAGTGKTTLAKILLNELGINEFDILYANGSKEARKIEWVDTLIAFSQTMPFGQFKVVLIDEADYMNPTSVQPALRNLMEDYSDTVRFILTCNYKSRLIPPIRSRCQTLDIAKPDITEFTTRVAKILLDESITFDLDLLDSYVQATYPDMRKCLNTLQPNSIGGKLIKSATQNEWRVECVELFKNGQVREGRNLIVKETDSDEVSINETFRWLYDNLNLWSDDPYKQDQAIIIICRGMANIPLVIDQEINLAATLCELSQLS